MRELPSSKIFPSLLGQKRQIKASIRYVLWAPADKGEHCYGKVVRQVCIFGIGDLKQLSQSTRHLFLNKFHLDFQYLTLDCWEQWMYNKTYAYYRDKQSTNYQRRALGQRDWELDTMSLTGER